MLGNTPNKVLRTDYKVPKNLSDFDPEDFIGRIDEFIEENIGKNEIVAISVSGGIDSRVAAHLLRRKIGNRLYLFFIDDGFRRIIRGREECDMVADTFKDFTNFEVIHAEDRFFHLFNHSSNGEVKRKTWQPPYTEISNEYIKKIGADWVADGTIWPDILETKSRFKLKTQHNIDLPYEVKKLELLASLYKPHVRRVAKVLGLPDDVAFGIPCPGPAQLIRVVGNVNREKLEVSKIATDVIEQMVEEYCEKMWGSKFKYDEATGVRQPFQMFGVVLDYYMEELYHLSDCISNSLKKNVKFYEMRNCATYRKEGVKSQKPSYKPIIWLESKDSLDFASLLNIGESIWNNFGYPRMLYSVYDSQRENGYLVAIRDVMSEDATEAEPMEIDFDYLSLMGKEIARRSEAVTKIAYDMSRKPPATIEFE